MYYTVKIRESGEVENLEINTDIFDGKLDLEEEDDSDTFLISQSDFDYYSEALQLFETAEELQSKANQSDLDSAYGIDSPIYTVKCKMEAIEALQAAWDHCGVEVQLLDEEEYLGLCGELSELQEQT
jgi:hypothetical protein